MKYETVYPTYLIHIEHYRQKYRSIGRAQTDVYILNQATEVANYCPSMLRSASQHLCNNLTVLQEGGSKKDEVMKSSKRKEKP